MMLVFSPVCLFLPGCGVSAVKFPAEPIAVTSTRADYDTDGNGRADFFYMFDSAGRITKIAYDRNADGKGDEIIHLDAGENQSPSLAFQLPGFW